MEPRIVLMDEPFSMLDVHTRRLTHRILPDLWQAERRSLIFITLISTRRSRWPTRVAAMSAGPASRMVGEVRITLPRPRDVSALQTTDELVALYREICSLLGR